MLNSRVWIVIPTFNALAVTRSCLSDLAKQTYRNVAIIISDGGSTDGTELIKNEFPSVIMIKGNPDWWWTKATNEGIRYALDYAEADDYIMTLNNDVAIPTDYICEMLRVGQQYRRSVIGSAIYDVNDPSRLVECGTYINWRTMKYQFLSLQDFDETGFSEKLMFFCGKGVLYPVSVFRKHGLFDEMALPHYAADQDFTASCRRWGYQLRVQKRIPLYSFENISAPSPADTKNVMEKIRLLFVRKSKVNLAVHFRMLFRHCPRRYWLTSAIFLTCRILGHIFVKRGVQAGPMHIESTSLQTRTAN